MVMTIRLTARSTRRLRERREEVIRHPVLFSNMGKDKREDLLEEEYNRFMEEVAISELPVYLLEMYGVPHVDNQPLSEE
jgi:hypothetical protein